MNYQEVRNIIKNECKKHGVKFHQGRGKTVRFPGSVRSNGFFYFDTESKDSMLAVAMNSNSLGVLIHEYSHMQQWLENAPEWEAIEKNTVMWEWLATDDYFEASEVEESVMAYYEVERDCERRAVDFHIQWNTDENLEEYIQKSNAYTLFYFFLLENRKWYVPGREPYSLKSVWGQMPKTFDFDVADVYNNVRHLFKACL